jgi:fucose 4-O-acetylase-like acetyltransferase
MIAVQRELRVDLLRVLGLLAIILAHVHPPRVLFQLRNFDVPLMVIVSGAAFGLSNARSRGCRSYIIKRAKRLLLPVWKFLTMYFGAVFLLAARGILQPLNVSTVVHSYLLTGGIGYVWIFRVFLLVALAAPLLGRLSRQMTSDICYFLILLSAYIGYELSLSMAVGHVLPGIRRILDLSLFHLWPYALVLALGIRLAALSRRAVAWIGIGSGILFVILLGEHWFSSGRFIGTQAFKYPPTAYYLSYAVFVCCFAWLLFGYIPAATADSRCGHLVTFASTNSDLIYLWHIPLVQVVKLPFYLAFPLVTLCAIVLTMLQLRYLRRFHVRMQIRALLKWDSTRVSTISAPDSGCERPHHYDLLLARGLPQQVATRARRPDPAVERPARHLRRGREEIPALSSCPSIDHGHVWLVEQFRHTIGERLARITAGCWDTNDVDP